MLATNPDCPSDVTPSAAVKSPTAACRRGKVVAVKNQKALALLLEFPLFNCVHESGELTCGEMPG
jgi:hypothetical protein